MKEEHKDVGAENSGYLVGLDLRKATNDFLEAQHQEERLKTREEHKNDNKLPLDVVVYRRGLFEDAPVVQSPGAKERVRKSAKVRVNKKKIRRREKRCRAIKRAKEEYGVIVPSDAQRITPWGYYDKDGVYFPYHPSGLPARDRRTLGVRTKQTYRRSSKVVEHRNTEVWPIASPKLPPYQEIHQIPGVYAIRHKHNLRVYVGQSTDLGARLREHMLDLLRGEHSNPEILKDLRAGCAEYFEFIILFRLEPASVNHCRDRMRNRVLLEERQWIFNIDEEYRAKGITNKLYNKR